MKNPVTPPGIDPGTVRLVAQRLNHYATPGPYTSLLLQINIYTNRPFSVCGVIPVLSVGAFTIVDHCALTLIYEAQRKVTTGF
jgi:hypothetical protein